MWGPNVKLPIGPTPVGSDFWLKDSWTPCICRKKQHNCLCHLMCQTSDEPHQWAIQLCEDFWSTSQATSPFSPSSSRTSGLSDHGMYSNWSLPPPWPQLTVTWVPPNIGTLLFLASVPVHMYGVLSINCCKSWWSFKSRTTHQGPYFLPWPFS